MAVESTTHGTVMVHAAGTVGHTAHRTASKMTTGPSAHRTSSETAGAAMTAASGAASTAASGTTGTGHIHSSLL